MKYYIIQYSAEVLISQWLTKNIFASIVAGTMENGIVSPLCSVEATTEKGAFSKQLFRIVFNANVRKRFLSSSSSFLKRLT